jgi:hypothetical protein
MVDSRNSEDQSEDQKVEKQDLIRCPHCGKSFRIFEGSQAPASSARAGGRFATWAFFAIILAFVVWLILPKPEDEHTHTSASTMADPPSMDSASTDELPEGHQPIDSMPQGAGSSSSSSESMPDGHPPMGGDGAMPPEIMEKFDTLKARVEANPTDTDALKELGNMYYDIAWANRAIEYYSKYLAIIPDDSYVLNDIGRMYIATGDTMAAIASLSGAIDLDSQLPQPYVNLGLAYAGAGEFEKSIEVLNKAVELSDDPALTDSAKSLIEQVKQALSEESGATASAG